MAKQPPSTAMRSGNEIGDSETRSSRSETDVKAELAASDLTTPLAMPIVGIGASAGGIEALGSFFDVMPGDSGCAFVVVLHLDPKHESEMAHILSARTAMPVTQVKDGMSIAPNHVYVIAPDTDLKVHEGKLRVSSPSQPRGQRHPVDVLFASIALEQRERAIAIVMSGTGSNGTQGLKNIRAVGGMSLVQSPETAKFDGMSRSAIAADMADHVLPLEAMPEAILRYVRHGYVAAPVEAEPSPPTKGEATLEQVLEILHARSGHDFSSYKRSTQRRRVHRRMGLRNFETLHEYMDELRANPEEVQTLITDLMINVTEFFRDPEAWQVLAEQVIKPLIDKRENGAAIRVWTAACSTGEEAYSIAMLITEQAEAAGKRFDLKVFATDAQEENLRKAREGIYPAAAVDGLSPERLRRFFENLDSSHQVTKELRDMVVFAAQNLLRDPPFSRLDVVSCRNVLIYLEPDAQQKIIGLCHFALKQGGHLFLGNAETVGQHDDLFETVSKKWRIYRRVGPTRHDLIDYPNGRGRAEPASTDAPSPVMTEPAAPVAEMARRALLEHFAPASVLIDQKGRVLYFHGATRDYLEQPSGEPTRDLLTMARDGLVLKLRGAIRAAVKDESRVTVNARVREGKTSRSVVISVMPLPASSAGDNLLVSFAPAPKSSHNVQPVREEVVEASSGERALQEELTTTRAELRNTIEHLETANEELKASNEEATSMNEELQSTNEELETSKEELQSFNEELNTVNNQLQHKIGELEGATNDLNNLLAGSETATLFLDDKFRIKWFAPATKELFDFVSSDIGRPISHFARKFSDENLLPDAETVLKKLTTIEIEVPSDAGRWYLRRMLPYRTRDNHIAGVVATFTDITKRKLAETARRESDERYRILFEAIDEGFCVIEMVFDKDDNPIDYIFVNVNPAFETQTGLQSAAGRRMRDLAPTHEQDWFDIYGRIALTGEPERFQHHAAALDRFYDVFAFRTGCPEERRVGVLFNDVTERMEAANALNEAKVYAQAIVETVRQPVIVLNGSLRVQSANAAFYNLFGASAGETEDVQFYDLGNGQWDIPVLRTLLEAVLTEKQTVTDYKVEFDFPHIGPRSMLLNARKLNRNGGREELILLAIEDITELQRADEHKKVLMGELNHRVKNTLAVVQSIATQTLGHAETLADAREAFGSRLINLARAHDVLTRESWTGANLADIVADTVKPHAGGKNRFRIDGPDIQFAPSAALAIAMALHELCTNAAKYGALSTENGHVAVRWSMEGAGNDSRLTLQWEESGGPEVVPPERKGFGSRLIERALAAELGGEVHVHYESSGVVCTIDAPMPAGREVGGTC